jgi:hypothetical protein
MRYFLKNIILFILPVIFIGGFSLELLLRRVPNNYSYKKKYLDEHAANINVLFLGSSHVYFGINPAYISGNSFNAAYVSQTLECDLAILNKYQPKLDSLRYIVEAVDYFSLYSTLESGPEAWRAKNYILYYDINISKNIAYHTEILSNNLSTNLDRFYNYYVKNGSDQSCTEFGWGPEFNSKNAEDPVATGIAAAKRHTVNDSKWVETNINILKSIIAIAKEKNVKVIFITCPAYISYSKNLSPRQMGNTINKVTELTHLNSNTIYHNFINDRSFTKADFFDGDHLNEIGAKKFSLKIDSLIKSDK